jgi:hypothetical protein
MNKPLNKFGERGSGLKGRSPKSEIRKKAEIRNPNRVFDGPGGPGGVRTGGFRWQLLPDATGFHYHHLQAIQECAEFRPPTFRILDFGLLSDFGDSDFGFACA